MPLDPCQVRLSRSSGSLLMGPGTPYTVLPGWDPWSMEARADQSGPRAWAHGSYAGAEWTSERIVPIPLSVNGSDRDRGAWLSVHQDLAQAFATVADTGEFCELTFEWGGRDYALFGRPRMVRVSSDYVAVGKAHTQCAFVAPDPRIYSADLWSAETTLPLMIGGLTVPYTVPYAVEASPIGGRIEFVNEGTADSGFLARIDGPAVEPRIAVRHPSGLVQTVQFGLTLHEGQWLEVDSARKIAPLNGSLGSNQRGNATWDMDQYPLIPGFNEVLFGAAEFAEGARLTVWARSAWW